MNQKVFGDVDLTVHTMRNPTMTNAKGQQYVYPGIVFQVNCQDCETPTQMGLEWTEVRTLLEGGALPGVTRTQDGWIIAVQCQNNEEGCKQVTQISITDEELEKHAAIEVARRSRVAKSQGGFAQQGQAAPQVARRPLPRR
jgi:hypothetical protein